MCLLGYRGSFIYLKYNFFKQYALRLHGSRQTRNAKEELVNVLCFLNILSVAGHQEVLILDYLHSIFHTFVFSHRYLYVLQTPRMCYLSRIASELLTAQNVKLMRLTRPKPNM